MQQILERDPYTNIEPTIAQTLYEDMRTIHAGLLNKEGAVFSVNITLEDGYLGIEPDQLHLSNVDVQLEQGTQAIHFNIERQIRPTDTPEHNLSAQWPFHFNLKGIAGHNSKDQPALIVETNLFGDDPLLLVFNDFTADENEQPQSTIQPDRVFFADSIVRHHEDNTIAGGEIAHVEPTIIESIAAYTNLVIQQTCEYAIRPKEINGPMIFAQQPS